MKALRISRSGSSAPELSIQDIPIPSPKPGELLVKIRASSVQPADILNSKGKPYVPVSNMASLTIPNQKAGSRKPHSQELSGKTSPAP
jgi:NADPH:quinone reductase-like Zn-dependent oxidoreductase